MSNTIQSPITHIHVQPAMSSFAHIHTYNPTDHTFEEAHLDEYKKTPGFAIRNVKGYNPYMLGPLMFVPGPNSLAQRAKRLAKERFYVTYSDWQDILLTMASIVGILLLCITFYTSWNSNVHLEYVYNDPADAKSKPEQLAAYNETWNGKAYTTGKTVLSAIPAMIIIWRIFKRTTIHRPGHEITSETVLQRMRARRDAARRVAISN